MKVENQTSGILSNIIVKDHWGIEDSLTNELTPSSITTISYRLSYSTADLFTSIPSSGSYYFGFRFLKATVVSNTNTGYVNTNTITNSFFENINLTNSFFTNDKSYRFQITQTNATGFSFNVTEIK